MEEIGSGEFDKQLKTNEVLYLLLYSPTDTHTPVCGFLSLDQLKAENSLTGADGESV